MRIMRQGGPAIGRAVGLLLAGIPIVDALAVSQVSLPLAFGFVALAPVLRLWQRWIAAT
jgi:4-hydroxybenzoate polyprenyltransferase